MYSYNKYKIVEYCLITSKQFLMHKENEEMYEYEYDVCKAANNKAKNHQPTNKIKSAEINSPSKRFDSELVYTVLVSQKMQYF